MARGGAGARAGVSFVPLSPEKIGESIRDHPLAWVVSDDCDATLLPLIVECDAAGTPVALVGHYPAATRRSPRSSATRGH